MKYKIDNISSLLINKETLQPIWFDDNSMKSVTLESEDTDVKFYGKPTIDSQVCIEGDIGNGLLIRIEGRYAGEVNEMEVSNESK